MSVNIEALGIDRLSVSERLELIEQIWNSLPEQVMADGYERWPRIKYAKPRPWNGRKLLVEMCRLRGDA